MKKRRYSCVRLNPHSSLFLFLRLSIFIFLTSSTSSTTLQNELRRRQSHQVEEDDLSPYHHQSTPSQNHRTPYPEQPEDPIVPTSSRGPKPSESVKIEEEKTEEELLPMERLKRAFGRNDYLLPENFKTLRRADIPVTYRLHDDLLRYYRSAKD
ncbi:Protein CBG18582 [Caenorhabditis briggsae]|uniref:Protein CBG18582 n=1 Tax=Caenorhabditis briggsae TaxID=6238 RepID=A8XTM6_CAEBR|nr:Protein CBG18582 [Caenorhabditis briggsae]CAP36002.2 Protein CBG18582 [Caenorhabditis briggsae]